MDLSERLKAIRARQLRALSRTGGQGGTSGPTAGTTASGASTPPSPSEGQAEAPGDPGAAPPGSATAAPAGSAPGSAPVAPGSATGSAPVAPGSATAAPARMSARVPPPPVPATRKPEAAHTAPASVDTTWEDLGGGLWRRFKRHHCHEWAALETAPWFPGWDRLRAGVPEGTASMDTETTGLSGGAGTVAFLAGHSRLVPGGNARSGDSAWTLETVQYFMDDYPAEPAFLDAWFADLVKCGELVSYNGASFDLPLIRTRAIMNGIMAPDLPHRDLLVPCRRWWKHLAGDARLGTLERLVLGVERVSDLPSAEVPERWLSSLGSGLGPRHPGLVEVFDHHDQDMANLLVLAALCAFLGPETDLAQEPRLDPVEARPSAPWVHLSRLPVGLRAWTLHLMATEPGRALDTLLAVLGDQGRDGREGLADPDEVRRCLWLAARLAWKTGRREVRVTMLDRIWTGWKDPRAGWSLALGLERQGQTGRAHEVLGQLASRRGVDPALAEKAAARLRATAGGGAELP